MQILKKHWILFTIFLVAAALRFWHLGTVPPSLTQDEASLGYNAYSILKTGKDEYGKSFPIIFKSFGDFKPGLYVYLDIPFTAAMGLNEVSTRLPSAVAGVMTVYLIYLVIGTLFTNHKSLAVISAFVAAVNPWLIYFSRGAWEANVSLTLTLAGIYFFLKALKQNRHFILSAVFFGLTMVTYQGAKLSSGIVVLVLLIIYRQEIFKFKFKYIIGGALVGLIISLPIILSFFNGQTGRLAVFSIFSYSRGKEYTQRFLDEGGEKIGDLNYYFFHSESLNFKRGILGRYFNHFSAKFLIFDGDYQNPGHSAPYQGMLLLGDLVFLAVGLIAVVKSHKSDPKPVMFVVLWLFLAPLPAILSRDQVQSVRAINMAVPLIIMVAMGLENIVIWIKTKKVRLLTYLLLTAIYAVGLGYFIDAYYVHVPAHNSNFWNYGYKEIVETLYPMKNDTKDILFEQSYAQPYIYFLYYGWYDPATYQKRASLIKGQNVNDVGSVERLGNILFTNIDWPYLQRNPRTVVVINGITWIPVEVEYKKINEIKYLNGRDSAFKIIEMK
jgi:4-amino-4-deoxy-L-arabinose transferase-like glycosyltransferase